MLKSRNDMIVANGLVAYEAVDELSGLRYLDGVEIRTRGTSALHSKRIEPEQKPRC